MFHDGRVLLTKRCDDVPYPGFWEFPGGKVEADEDPMRCVERELMEELGITVRADAIYDAIFYRYPERTVLVLVYRCSWLAGNIQNLQVAEYRWVEPSALMGYGLLPADISLAERLAREFGDADTPCI
jgi:8-oxo-dGTP diphosphatase